MRRLAFGIAAAVVVVTSGPALAAWKEFKYEDLGLIKEFPADPKVEMGTYKTPVAGTAPARIFTVEQDNAKFILTVVDLMNKVDQGASIMGECAFKAEDAGKLVESATTRVEPGPRAVYGRLVTEDLKDGSRSMTACFFTKGRLYDVQAIILPSNDDFPNSPQAIRFVNSLSFDLRDDAPGREPAEGGGGRGGRGGAAAQAAGGEN